MLTPDVLREAFGIEARVFRDETDGAFIVLPVRAIAAEREAQAASGR